MPLFIDVECRCSFQHAQYKTKLFDDLCDLPMFSSIIQCHCLGHSKQDCTIKVHNLKLTLVFYNYQSRAPITFLRCWIGFLQFKFIAQIYDASDDSYMSEQAGKPPRYGEMHMQRIRARQALDEEAQGCPPHRYHLWAVFSISSLLALVSRR